MKLGSRSGFGLVLLVMIIAIAGIVLLASDRVLQQSMRHTQLRIDQTKAHYLAQAGVVRAAWDWYVSNTTTDTSRRWSPLNTTVTGNMLFKAGSDSAAARLHSNYAYYTSTSAPSIEFIQNITTNAVWTSSAASIVGTLTAAVSIGDFVVVSVATDGGGTGTFSCADNRGNSYTIAANVIGATNSAVNVRTMLCYAPVTTALLVGDTITVAWTTSIAARAISACSFRSVAGFDSVASASTNNAPTTTPNSGNATANFSNDLLFGAIGVEGPTGDTFTPTVVSPVWTRNQPTRISTGHATAASNVTINPMYRIVSATGSYASSATITSRDWGSIIGIFKEHDRWYTVPATTNRQLRRWQVYNINNGNSITLTQMKVSWTGGGIARLTEIKLNNTSVWTGTGTTGSVIDIADTSIANGGLLSGVNTYLQWNNSGPTDPVTVTCQFYFSGDSSTSDAKSHEVILWDGAQSGAGLPLKRDFTVTSTGQVNQTNEAFKVLKTVKAVISGTPGTAALEVTDWDEGDKNIP